jgi:hypothetical protein
MRGVPLFSVAGVEKVLDGPPLDPPDMPEPPEPDEFEDWLMGLPEHAREMNQSTEEGATE